MVVERERRHEIKPSELEECRECSVTVVLDGLLCVNVKCCGVLTGIF